MNKHVKDVQDRFPVCRAISRGGSSDHENILIDASHSHLNIRVWGDFLHGTDWQCIVSVKRDRDDDREVFRVVFVSAPARIDAQCNGRFIFGYLWVMEAAKMG